LGRTAPATCGDQVAAARDAQDVFKHEHVVDTLCIVEVTCADSGKTGYLGNPVEGERDSGLKPNTIPL